MTASAEAADHKADNIPLAIGAIVFTVFALSLGDVLIKQVSAGFVLWQIFVVRSLLVIPVVLLALMIFVRHGTIIPRRVGWTSLRSLMLVVMWIAYYVSLPHLQLSVAAASYYTLPLFITLLSAFFTGEKIRKAGWVAVIMGFGGVLLILRPVAGNFNAWALLPLISAMLFALSMILTRTRCRMEHPLTLSLALNICFVLVGGIAAIITGSLTGTERSGFLTGSWTSMGTDQWYVMGLLAVAILIGSIGAATAYQNGPSSIVGTFDFSYIGFAVIWGLVFFDEIPDAVSVSGIAMIVTASLLSLRP